MQLWTYNDEFFFLFICWKLITTKMIEREWRYRLWTKTIKSPGIKAYWSNYAWKEAHKCVFCDGVFSFNRLEIYHERKNLPHPPQHSSEQTEDHIFGKNYPDILGIWCVWLFDAKE